MLNLDIERQDVRMNERKQDRIEQAEWLVNLAILKQQYGSIASV